MKKTIAKINENKSQFFEKISKIDKLLATFIIEKERRLNKIINEKGKVITNITEI